MCNFTYDRIHPSFTNQYVYMLQLDPCVWYQCYNLPVPPPDRRLRSPWYDGDQEKCVNADKLQ